VAFALVSDIHGDAQALDAVRADLARVPGRSIEFRRCDR